MKDHAGRVLPDTEKNTDEMDPLEMCVHTHFEAEVERSSDKVALMFGDVRITYAELNRRANQIANRLLSNGVCREDFVGIAMKRSPELIASILGVLKAGAAYLPLDLDVPQERLATILDDAQPAIILTESGFLKAIPLGSAKVICLDEVERCGTDSENPNVRTEKNGLAYVMYTSGSTGRPKGVMIEHRSIVRLVKQTDYADFGSDNVFLQFAPMTFDASTFEIWGALLNGGTLAIMPDGVTSLAELGNAIREYGVTTLWLTAGLFHLMVDERIDDLRPLRQLLAGGDVLSATHVRKVLENLNCDLINGYGPTENTTFTCTYKIARDADLGRSIPIGKPIANTQVVILDESLRPVKNGETGELYIGGAGLARGYLNDEKLTAERFITNPLGEIPSAKLYRSGDLARFRPDGNIEFLGRADRQVKIRGFRIELEEIEIALTSQDGIREAIVVAKEISAAEKQLIAFVVADRGLAVDVRQLRDRLSKILPSYMVPAVVTSIEALPLTANGKVDRDLLLKLSESSAQDRSRSNKPSEDTEGKMAAILEEILGIDLVRTTDNFFDIGADSLQLARFHNRLQKDFSSDLKMVSLFENPTVRSLARSIGSDNSHANTTELRSRAARQRDAYSRRRQMLNGGS